MKKTRSKNITGNVLEEEILKTAREKDKGTTIWMTNNSSSETAKAKNQWYDIIKVLKEKTSNTEFYIQWKYSSRIKVKNKYFKIK